MKISKSDKEIVLGSLFFTFVVGIPISIIFFLFFNSLKACLITLCVVYLISIYILADSKIKSKRGYKR